jgi:chitinase
MLTTAIPAGEWCLRNIDLAATSKSCDFINVMAYDFAGKWTEVSGHQAQLRSPDRPDDAFSKRSVENVVRYLKSHGVSLKKALIGIPVYGRSFLGVTGPGQQFMGQGGKNGMIEYRDLPRPGTHEIVDEQLGAAFCVGADGGFVSYDNPETVEMKAKYVKTNKLGGLFYWTGSYDADESPRSLVETGYKCLNL